jgi:Protein of unknown function (DUF1638)
VSTETARESNIKVVSVRARPNEVTPTLVIACGALTKELRAVFGQLKETPTIRYLPAPLHNRPERIPDAVDALINETIESVGGVENCPRIVLGYADCGTGGLLDALVARRRQSGMQIDRLPGAHCYEFFSGAARFAELTEASLGTFYLTDYLALHFVSLVWTGLGLDRHPELRDMYFGNYDRVTLISQTQDVLVIERAASAAAMLGLRFEQHHVGLDPLTNSIRNLLA